jgi:hypothetical protein
VVKEVGLRMNVLSAVSKVIGVVDVTTNVRPMYTIVRSVGIFIALSVMMVITWIVTVTAHLNVYPYVKHAHQVTRAHPARINTTTTMVIMTVVIV